MLLHSWPSPNSLPPAPQVHPTTWQSATQGHTCVLMKCARTLPASPHRLETLSTAWTVHVAVSWHPGLLQVTMTEKALCWAACGCCSTGPCRVVYLCCASIITGSVPAVKEAHHPLNHCHVSINCVPAQQAAQYRASQPGRSHCKE